MINGLTGNVCTTSDYRLANLQYNSIATRLIYSADCYAVTDAYPEGNPTIRPMPGVLEKSKLYGPSGFYNLGKCVGLHTDAFDMKLETISWVDGGVTKTTAASTLGSTDSDPDGANACEFGNWDRVDSSLVKIKDGETLTDAILTLCINVAMDPKSEGVCD